MADELGKIQGILAENRGKTFVSRVERPQEFPSLDLGGGFSGTHLMSYGDRPGGGYMVYPEIIFDHRSGTLRQLSRADAHQHAILTGNFIPFQRKAEAAWFSKNYKKAWRK
jgi:hypothetical protein